MITKQKAAGLAIQAAFNDAETQREYLTARLARTKLMLIEAHKLGALTFPEAETMTSRMRRRFPFSWRAA